MGGYSTGPFLGKIVDAKGPRYLLAGGFIFLLIGYSGIRYIFDNGISPSKSISAIKFWSLVACSFITGVGGHGACASVINATAKSFPHEAVGDLIESISFLVLIGTNKRATTTGLVLSGFGLSAFVFSSFSSRLFSEDTSSFLLLLALGTSFPMMIGFFLVRPIPVPAYESRSRMKYHTITDMPATNFEDHVAFQRECTSRTPLLSAVDDVIVATSLLHTHNESSMHRNTSHTQSPSPDANHYRSRSNSLRLSLGSSDILFENLPNIHGKQLWMSDDFWIIFFIMLLCASWFRG